MLKYAAVKNAVRKLVSTDDNSLTFLKEWLEVLAHFRCCCCSAGNKLKFV